MLLQSIIDSGHGVPGTTGALQAVLNGRTLTAQQVAALRADLTNPGLDNLQKGAIASALQQNKQLQLQQALLQAVGKDGKLLGQLGNLLQQGLNGAGGGSGGGDGGGSGGGDGGGDGGGAAGPAGSEMPDPTPAIAEPVGEDVSPASPLWGVKVTELYEGTAAKQGLVKGDIILSFNGIATPTYEDLRSAVQQSGNRAAVIFLNVENGQRESIILYPENSAIGVDVVPVQVE